MTLGPWDRGGGPALELVLVSDARASRKSVCTIVVDKGDHLPSLRHNVTKTSLRPSSERLAG